MIFRPNHIVDHFKREEIINEKLCDFLPRISHSKTDQAILKTWKDHFTLKGVPWIVTMTDGNPANFVLWKKDARLDGEGVRREQRKEDVAWFKEGCKN